jgi:ribosomal protein S12 methylthiotransferase accessory factor
VPRRSTEALAARAIAPRTGIIKRIMSRMIEPDDPRLFHAVTSCTNASRLHGQVEVAGFTGNGGAGLTAAAARAAAIGETIERYCSAAYDERANFRLSYEAIVDGGLAATPPATFALHSEAQYRRPGFMLQPFTPERTISWVPGLSLVHDRQVLAPACLVHMPFRYRDPGDLIAFGVSSGLSCREHLVEACLGGLYEVVERDAIMCMWMNRLPMPRLTAEPGSWLARVLAERFAPSGLEICLNDITTDLGIPVVFARLIDHRNDRLAVSVGASANLDPTLAAVKALMEAAQVRLWLKLLRREPPRAYREDFSDVITFEDHVRLYASPERIADVAFLNSAREVAAPSPPPADPQSALRRCLDALAARGHDVIAVELTTPDVAELGLHVVKVLVPGLAELNADHNYPRLGGTRLYTVPRALGHLDRDSRESELNPTPHPFP